MRKLRRAYAVALTAITCLTCLISGIITAEKNTRYMSFGEEYKAINLSDITLEEIKDLF